MTAALARAVATGPVREPALTIAGYTSAWSAAADRSPRGTGSEPRISTPAAVLANAEVARRELLDALEEVGSDPVLAGRRGPIRAQRSDDAPGSTSSSYTAST